MIDGLTIRPWDRAAEEGFVYNSWLESLRHDIKQRSCDARHIRERAWYAGQHGIIDGIFDDCGGVVWVGEIASVVVGWLCEAGPTIHYAYVKEAYRGHGIYRALMGDRIDRDPIVVSHLTRRLLTWMAHGLPYEFDPYAAMRF